MTTSVLEKGRGYMNQSKISFTYGSGASVEMEGEKNTFLSRVEVEIRSCRRIESHDDILPT